MNATEKQQLKDVEFRLENAKTVWRSVEFIVTFGVLFLFLFILGFGKLIAFVATLVAYAIVNGVIYFNLSGLKEKLEDLKEKI